MQKKGFTLSEVLITLAVIGTVAALTIPAVVSNYQKHQTVTRLKKTYSALANTTNLAIADHGPVEG
jgi:prepilin-type N-terminal cleavage/methylation domain-containing protein